MTSAVKESSSLALLVSADPVTIRYFSRALQELSISPDVFRETPAAINQLNRQKFDAVIVDLQLGELAGKVLNEVHLSPSNRTAVTFGISGNDAESTAVLRQKSSFVFEKPLSAQSIRSTLKSAYGLILRERRRYFRCPVSIPVLIRRQGVPDAHCSTVNISQGGMALSTIVSVNPGEKAQVQFTLPGHEVLFLAEATICWSKTDEIGVRFVAPSQDNNAQLQEWLARKLEEMLPDFVSKKFEKMDVRPVSSLSLPD